ncbi:ATP-binding cassette domain-containing protein [Stenotrophomonas forensis]|uniref:ABC transporter ATP-binding protein n=1 Tax=Stenotrophomonas forensis TaxID=2871169 RepID=UPI0018D31BDF|nr:ABC transporter ATP-binding protein [Stenotrophomonas maltophilia]MBH1599151.1 ABC transporter ATP-binding protein [Stenotrophomonas maltophilia]
MQEPVILLNRISKTFLTDEVETQALSDINLTVARGEYVSICGPSGCGKSTLLALLGLLDVPSAGEYTLNGRPAQSLSATEQAQVRNLEIGFIFQSFNLISDLTVAENVELPLTYRKGVDAAERRRRAADALEKLGMSHRAKHYPSQLSGGQQQRIAIARALVTSPSLLLADEPTGNLDSRNAEVVMQILKDLHEEGRTICIVTHDPELANAASRKVILFDGRIVSDTSLSQAEAVVNAETRTYAPLTAHQTP